MPEPTHAREHWLRLQAEEAVRSAQTWSPADDLDNLCKKTIGGIVSLESALKESKFGYIRASAIVAASFWLRIAAWAHRLEVREK